MRISLTQVRIINMHGSLPYDYDDELKKSA